MINSIGRMFELTVQKYPHREALVYPDKNQRWTYSQWDRKVNQLANAFLDFGIKKGDRVSTFLFNSSEMVTTLFALAKIGAIFNPINFRLSGGELAFILNDAGSRILLFEAAVAEQVEVARKELQTVEKFLFVDANPPEYAQCFYEFFAEQPEDRPKVDEIEENDRYIIMYTSGTTGKPKGVIHRHRDMLEHNVAMIADQKLTYRDRGLCAAPLNHSAELHCFFLSRVHIGATNVIIHHFDPPKVLEILAQEQISVFFGAPTMLNMLLQLKVEDYDLSALRLIGYGGAAMAPAMVKKCHEVLGADLLQYYGMTELGPAVTVLYPEEQLERAGSAGKSLLNHEVRVVRVGADGPSDPEDLAAPGEVGMIIVRGPARMEGYFNRPEATAKALYKDWYHSGDLARIDEDGYIWINDRADDMIISGAENIYPREVEDVLYEHPEVVEAAVVGLVDEKWGKLVTAFVVVKNPGITPEDLDSFLKSSNKLASFKRPRRYEILEQLPKTPSGKIQKFKLVELFGKK